MFDVVRPYLVIIIHFNELNVCRFVLRGSNGILRRLFLWFVVANLSICNIYILLIVTYILHILKLQLHIMPLLLTFLYQLTRLRARRVFWRRLIYLGLVVIWPDQQVAPTPILAHRRCVTIERNLVLLQLEQHSSIWGRLIRGIVRALVYWTYCILSCFQLQRVHLLSVHKVMLDVYFVT